jgi:hypothetical protein
MGHTPGVTLALLSSYFMMTVKYRTTPKDMGMLDELHLSPWKKTCI